MKTLLHTLPILALSAGAALAQASHGMDHSNMPMTDQQMEGGVHATATINEIGAGTANVSHGPIPEIGWPPMTMDLPLLEGAEMMGEVSPGDEVTLMLIKGDDGMYAIGAIMPN
ncbi:copper-binding protein [Tropicimonas marinistellae]|uniref:copper-binding protein n=1 Tax=Tropicimonas marinistellae TaxID=1739787 RepID=UPI00082C4287|nr:copper-binding protein [Tropicimonas marinistellae]